MGAIFRDATIFDLRDIPIATARRLSSFCPFLPPATTPPTSAPVTMSQTPTRVQFTVGKLDAGMAILLTHDHHQIEFPSILLPKTVSTGSVIDLSVIQNPQQEQSVHAAFLALQAQIRDAFASKSPSTPLLTLRSATQTSAVLEWEPIDIATAELKSLTLWRDGTRLGNIPKPLATTTTKLSGLGIDTDYTFQLILRTTAGTYPSTPLKIRTHKMTNLTGIQVAAGTLPPDHLDRLQSAISAIGAKALQKRVRIDTTHFICSVPEGEEWQRARDMNVPVVVVDWIEACQREGKIVGVRGYYLDADPALRVRQVTVVSPAPSSVRRSVEGSSGAGSAAAVNERETSPPVPEKTNLPVPEKEGVAVPTEPVQEAPKEPAEPATEEESLKEEAEQEQPSRDEEKFDDVPI